MSRRVHLWPCCSCSLCTGATARNRSLMPRRHGRSSLRRRRPRTRTPCTARSTRFSTSTCATASSTTGRCKSSAAGSIAMSASLNVPAATYEGWSREEKMAFWVNAYNAFVLQTVIDRYPIRGTSRGYPSESIRQIPGAFETTAAPRRRAETSRSTRSRRRSCPSSRSRAFIWRSAAARSAAAGCAARRTPAARLPQQLEAIQKEFVIGADDAEDRSGSGEVSVTPILSWHEAEFIARVSTRARRAVRRSDRRSSAPIIAFITPEPAAAREGVRRRRTSSR